MFITLEKLEEFGACEKGRVWFEKYFPNGGELEDILHHKHITPEILHWGFAHLYGTEADKEYYWEKLQINSPKRETIYESEKIDNSVYVSHSYRVYNSEYIFSSKNIKSCNNVFGSDNIQDSSQIFGSEFADNSKQVLQCKNITNSQNIVYSDFVVDSHSIINSVAVTDSAFIGGLQFGHTKQIKNSRFVSDCTNVKHCLFCHNIHDAEYMIFNKQVDRSDYELIVHQLDNLLKNWDAELVKNRDWPEYVIPLDAPQVQRNIIKQYADLPEPFWRWIKTLPMYDASILYALTFNNKLLEKEN